MPIKILVSVYHQIRFEAYLVARVLFLHHNFPAQFRFLALHLAEQGHDVVFLSERNIVGDLPGIRQISIAETHNPLIHSNLKGQLACSARFRDAMTNLREQGWRPDVVLSHSGWGCGLDVGWIFPQARRLVYLEWWFSDDAADYDFKPADPWWNYSKATRLKLRQRNLTLAYELVEADVVVAPTHWQRSQLPSALQSRCQVIHEGVDTDFFVMNPAWRSKDRLRLTYATRGMEPMRGFPEFVEVLPELLKRWPKVEVLIAGEDRVAYGAHMPEEGSFGRWAKARLQPLLEEGRVRFVGHLPYEIYARLLKSSHVHCYLTRPFVVSWSLLDAMASGCCLVASDVKPVREVAHHAATEWVDHRDPSRLLQGLENGLSLSESDRLVRGRLQRSHAKQLWGREASLGSWLGLLGI